MVDAIQQPHLGQLNLGAQGKFKKALFVCSGGMLRSATAAQHAYATKGWNTRSCGIMDAALPPHHPNLMQWADAIYCMENHHSNFLSELYPWASHKLHVLNIPDIFYYRDSQLLDIISEKLKGW